MEYAEKKSSLNAPLLTIDMINGVKFTSREIDVLACILEERSAKKIASFLSISPKTIEKHIHHIMLKLECNSRESIKDFLESSPERFFLKNHYTNLSFKIILEKKLKELSTQNLPETTLLYISHWLEEENYHFPFFQLEKHLKSVGVRVRVEVEGKKEPCVLNSLIKELKDPSREFHLIVIPAHLKEAFLKDKMVSKLDIFTLSTNNLETYESLLFLLLVNKEKIIFNFSKISPNQQEMKKDYYLFLFEILRRLFPKHNFDDSFLKIERYYEENKRSLSQNQPDEKLSTQKKSTANNRIFQLPKNKQGYLFLLSFIGVLIFFYCTLSIIQSAKDTENQKKVFVRSDFIIPHQNILLQRPEIMAEIERKLKGQQGIQILALVGPGGAGKTTLARQYAHQQKTNVIWEINAETIESLKDSFEKLAQHLATAEEDQKILRGIQDIKDSQEREEELIQFVKEKLRANPSWFLVYDNVENLKNIQPYFPNDPHTWGKGKALITTRDSNIQNYLHHSVILGDLDENQKLELFLKIINTEKPQNFTATQKKEMKQFLKKIPPFPLDVSMASYYIKLTSVPYEKYLAYIKQNSKEFETIQHSILKEAGDSTKTRYGIITLSLEKLIETHKDFEDLLLFTSLLGSQNIPRDLLIKYKTDLTVDHFIYHLQKYSLVRMSPVPSVSAIQTLSIHRSTQAIALSYLIKKLELEKNKKRIQSISRALENYLVEAIDQDDTAKIWSLYSHIISYLSHSPILLEEDRAQIQSELGFIESEHLKNNVKGKKILEESYLVASKYYEKAHPRLGKILTYLGIVCRRLGEYEKAKEFLQQGLNIYKNHFPEDHPKVMWILANLGNTYRNLGAYKQAQEILEQVFENYKKNIPQNKAVYARIGTYLGITYKDLGDYKKSAEFLNQSLFIYKTYFSSMHPDMTWILGILGDTYRRLGENVKAKDFLEQGLALQKQYSPNNANENNWFMFLLGKVYRELGEYQKAKTFLETALEYYREHYGKEHLETAHIMRSLGQTYFLEGKLDIAENLFLKTLKIFQQLHATDQYTILEDLAALNLKKAEQEEVKGNIALSQNFKNKARHELKDALQIVKNNFPENSPHISRIKEKLGTIK